MLKERAKENEVTGYNQMRTCYKEEKACHSTKKKKKNHNITKIHKQICNFTPKNLEVSVKLRQSINQCMSVIPKLLNVNGNNVFSCLPILG